MSINIDIIDKEFKEYVKTFDMDNKDIYLKYEHTFEVVKVMELLCKKMNLDEEQTNLAKTIAYFHDLGRFEQLRSTNTYRDDLMDHAEYGADLLIKEDYISKFSIDEKYYQVIEKAVRHHNKLDVIGDLTKEEELFVKLIRDADKIDIYRVIVKFFESNFIVEPTEINLIDFYNHKAIDKKNIKNKSDSLLCQLAFIYDLNYQESIEALKDYKYYQKFIESINVSDEEKETFNKIKQEVYKYLDIKEC